MQCIYIYLKKNYPAQPVWSVLQSDCVMADQPQKFSTWVTYVIKLSKAYKTSSNVLKEIIKLSKEKYK